MIGSEKSYALGAGSGAMSCLDWTLWRTSN
jgi:hypothetical protein